MPRRYLWTARLMLLGLVVFAVYYPYKLLSSFLPFVFSGPTGWQGHWMVDDAVIVPLSGRLAQFFLWVPTILATQIMLIAAILLVVTLLRGAYFEARTVRWLKWVGGLAAFAGASALGAMAFDAWMLTRWNTDLPVQPIRFRFESGEMGVLLTGLGLFLLGLVLELAVLKRRENEEIV